MGLSETIWSDPTVFFRAVTPEEPVLFFSAVVLRDTARRFVDGFPGQVTFAVKSNPSEEVLMNLAASGITGWDVASMAEIAQIRAIAPEADLHYNNPVRTPAEISFAVAQGVLSYSVDSHSELDKLIALVPPRGHEVAVRFKLPVKGAAYDFGTKFGAAPDLAVALLRRVAKAGFTPSLTFHPGTQCTDPMAWRAYIAEAAAIARGAGVRVARLNTGGGFPSHRLTHETPSLEAIFAEIDRAATDAFGDDRPALICEPGRGLVAECFQLAARVKAIRDDGPVFLNDGVYGALAELTILGAIDRVRVLAPGGGERHAAPRPRVVFGPTCDSLDRLPGELALAGDMAEGDYVLFSGLGAYSTATLTRFNGFGDHRIVTVTRPL